MGHALDLAGRAHSGRVVEAHHHQIAGRPQPNLALASVAMRLALMPRIPHRLMLSSRYGCLGGPISGVWTGFAKPKKTTVPLAPKRVDRAGSGTSLKPCSGRSQLFATHTLPAGSTATSVMICSPPM